MKISLMCCEQTLLDEISDKSFKKKNIAQTYALALRSDEDVDFKEINKAIIARWSMRALSDIKKMAWSGSCYNS